ncbi:MAG TPA: hypothetical protein VL463_18265 [Kofleriaceae bacterium]|jgi:hypothetical protein|nr:hypothetical protein [Kofleriaceae bacterium]
MTDRDLTPLPDELRALFEAERASPIANEAHRAAIRAKLGATVGGATAFGGAAKVIALIVGVAIAGTAATWYLRDRDRAPAAAIATTIAPPRSVPPALTPPPPSRTEEPAPPRPPPPHARSRTMHAPAPTEASLLADAWRAADRDPERALALVAEATARYPDGALAEERDAIRIEALAAAHRDDEARAAAGIFLDRYPDSVHRPIAEAALRGEESP